MFAARTQPALTCQVYMAGSAVPWPSRCGRRRSWTAEDQRTTMVVLVEGTFRVDLTEGSVTLTEQGDYLASVYATWAAPGRS
jgi:hypothetical protein